MHPGTQLSLLSPAALSGKPARPTATVPGFGLLFLDGDRALLDAPAVSVVGSRRASHAGRALAADVAVELVRRGFVVMSGLAAGIDATAHECAMHAGGRTIAVIGTSLDQAYPRHHASLQERIAIEHLVVSPFESGTPMARWHFPKRNRLMAQLARAMVLVEAGATSGTRHQVEECLSLGKPVFIRASLLRDGIEWLNTAYLRARVGEWRDASELAERVEKSLAVR